MEVTKEIKSGIPILYLKGEITFSTVDTLKQSINELVREGEFNAIISLKDVVFIDSSGIGSLVGGLSTLRRHNGVLKLLNINPSLVKLFGLTGLMRFFEVFEDEFEAIDSFSK